VGTFAVINYYLQKAVLVVMPVAGVMLVVYSAYQLWTDLRGTEKKRVKDRLKEERARKKAKAAEESFLRSTASQHPFYEKLLGNLSVAGKLQKWTEQANLDVAGAKLLVNLLLAGAVVFTVGLLAKFNLWLVLGLAVSVLLLPLFVISKLAKRRMNKLVLQLPDVFELIGQALRAGHSLASGIQLVGKQLPDPAGTEFGRVFHEQNLGLKIEDSLRDLAERTDRLDVRFFVTAVLIQRQTGGDLAEIMDKISNVIRGRIQIMGQVKALTAEGRMSGWVLCALPVFVFFLAWSLNPDYANVLLFDEQGKLMLYGAIFMQIVGMLMIKKIVNIKI